MTSKAVQIGRAYGLPKVHKPYQHLPKFLPIIDTINTPYDRYTFVSFDVESLFTKVPLKRTIKIILNRVYSEKKISRTLSKRSLKKLLLDACTKTTFSFNKKFCEQIDGVSMGSPLGLLMANVIMTELQRVVVKDLFNKGYLKFYIRYLDNTLVLMKKSDVPIVYKHLMAFIKI